MFVFNNVANYLTIAALVFLGAKVGEQSEMIFHWLIFFHSVRWVSFLYLIIYEPVTIISGRIPVLKR